MKKLLLSALCAILPVLAGAADSAMSNFVADGVKPWYYNNSVIDNAHGKLFRLSVDVTAVGDGDTTLSLWTGHANNALSKVAERAVTATGTQSFDWTSDRAAGDWEYFRIKMEQVVGATTNETWLPALNYTKNWAYIADGQVYEWTGGDSGGAWEDAANWRSTGEIDFVGTPTGYPASESVGGAAFPAGTNVVAIGSRKVVPFVRTAAGTALELVGANGTPPLEIDAWAGAGFAGLSAFTVDNVDLFWSPEIAMTRTDAVFCVTNGGHWLSRIVWPQGARSTFRVAAGSTLEMNQFWNGSADGLVEIEGTVSMAGPYYAGYVNATGSKTVLKGSAPSLVFSSASATCAGGEGVDGTLEFVVPAGGWEQAPVRGAAGGTAKFAVPYKGSGDLVVNVDPDSPAATTDGVTDAVLVSWPGGFDTTHLVYGTLPNPATDSFYVQNNPNTNVPELHVRIFGQAQGEADPTVTAVSVGDLTRSGATVSAAVMLGGAASSATVSLLLSVNGGAESVATNETVSTSGMVVFPVAGLPSGATCRFRVQAVNSYGRSAVSDPVEVRLLARYAEFAVAGEGVSLARANGDTVAEFTADGTLTVLRGGEAEVLVVAGGGAGGTAGNNYAGAGGGAGGVVHLENLWLDAGDYAVVVGAGGAPSTSRAVLGKNGGNSSFWSYVATGGGAGCCPYVASGARSGGSGGGGVGNAFGNNYGANAGIAGQGNDGGRGSSGWIPGGGGGAGAAGDAGATGQSGAGGAGLSFVFGKTTYEVGGGGGAGAYNTEPGGATHGGGAGGAAGSSGANGAAHTGGGGGGAGKASSDTSGGAGGSGLVLVRMHTGLDGTLLLFK